MIEIFVIFLINEMKDFIVEIYFLLVRYCCSVGYLCCGFKVVIILVYVLKLVGEYKFKNKNFICINIVNKVVKGCDMKRDFFYKYKLLVVFC